MCIRDSISPCTYQISCILHTFSFAPSLEVAPRWCTHIRLSKFRSIVSVMACLTCSKGFTPRVAQDCCRCHRQCASLKQNSSKGRQQQDRKRCQCGTSTRHRTNRHRTPSRCPPSPPIEMWTCWSAKGHPFFSSVFAHLCLEKKTDAIG